MDMSYTRFKRRCFTHMKIMRKWNQINLTQLDSNHEEGKINYEEILLLYDYAVFEQLPIMFIFPGSQFSFTWFVPRTLIFFFTPLFFNSFFLCRFCFHDERLSIIKLPVLCFLNECCCSFIHLNLAFAFRIFILLLLIVNAKEKHFKGFFAWQNPHFVNSTIVWWYFLHDKIRQKWHILSHIYAKLRNEL
jgi:hypothetical protein